MKALLARIVDAVKDVKGIEAIVLGGSRARGTQGPGSDIDIGLYYDRDTIDLPRLEEAARALDQAHRENLLAKPREWGQWVDGGCWLIMDSMHVDLILREVSRVKQAIEDCEKGKVTSHYQAGHPHGYFNAMYRGELAVSRLLWHRGDEIVRWKRAAEEYPRALQKALVDFFFFEAGFSLMLAENTVARDDAYYVTAHLVRSVSALNQVLFALNQQYCINEKKAVKMIDSFPIRPDRYKEKVDVIFSLAGADLAGACRTLKELIGEVDALLGREDPGRA